jgi:hypothetical protein
LRLAAKLTLGHDKRHGFGTAPLKAFQAIGRHRFPYPMTAATNRAIKRIALHSSGGYGIPIQRKWVRRMVKLGRPYETLVGLIEQALHPDATVEVGQWVEGPDGEREIDVSIKGAVDGKDTFVFLECKDWKKQVGIETIDAVDSKRQDLGADRTIVVSNSGFTAGALNKARRKDIVCMSAMAEGNETVRFVLYREFLAKRLSVTGGTSHVAYLPNSDLPTPLEPKDLEYEGLKLTAWMRDHSVDLLREHQFATTIKDQVVFRQPVDFLHLGKLVSVTGITMTLQCKRTWVVQTIKEDVSKGMYDHLKEVLLIPHKELWSLEFDNRNWKEITPEHEPDRSNTPLGTVQLHMDLFQPACPDEKGIAPLLAPLILNEETLLESACAVSAALKRFDENGCLQYAEQHSWLKPKAAQPSVDVS